MSTTELASLQRTSVAPVKVSSRLLSVDVYRGLSVAGMLLVDYQGDESASYWGLHHPKWNGWSTADLVFPSFLFLTGVSIVLAYSARLQRGETRAQIARHAATRTILLVALAIFLNGVPDFNLATWRIEGVVQRIAICYLIAGLLFLWTGSRGLIVTAGACLVGYWALLCFAPVPGIGVPGRDVPFLAPDRNLVDWLDRAVFPGRLWNGTHDPEGILSTIPAVATALMGVLTGQWLRSNRGQQMKAQAMLMGGILAVVLGLVWSRWFPINKNLWTSSFVLLTGGIALIALAMLYWIVEVRQRRGPWTTPFVVFGSNAIIAYCLDETLWALFARPYAHAADGSIISWQQHFNGSLEKVLSPANASLVFAMGAVLLCWLLMLILYRKRIFVKF